MRRHAANPILTRADIPASSPHLRDVSSVFNPGAVRSPGGVLLMLRVQTRGRETLLMLAEGADGVCFTVRPEPLELEGAGALEPRPIHLYDPRLTRLDGELLVVASADTEAGCHPVVARLEPVAGERRARLRLLSYDAEREARNGVLFPERIGGLYCRLERPNDARLASGTPTGDRIWLSVSEDLVQWRPERPVMAGRPRFWDELIGSGPPPLKTREGWLHVYHGVATHLGSGLYQAGVCLLDLQDPGLLVARGRNNVLEPRESYETTGQVPNVVFPTGLVLFGADGGEGLDEEGFALPSARVLLYYGAADTCVGLAESTVGELLEESRLE